MLTRRTKLTIKATQQKPVRTPTGKTRVATAVAQEPEPERKETKLERNQSINECPAEKLCLFREKKHAFEKCEVFKNKVRKLNS